jgi:hypothetical protein
MYAKKFTTTPEITEHRELLAELVRESGRFLCELSFPWLDRAKAATVD